MIKQTDLQENDSKVVIFGREYNIRSMADPAYTKKLADYVDKKMAEVDQQTHSPNVLGVSILTLLHLANELFKVSGESQDLKRQINQRVGKLLDLVSEPGESFLENSIQENPQTGAFAQAE